VWSQAWKDAALLGLGDDQVILWEDYIRVLKVGHIHISKREDELVWQHNPLWVYTSKSGYTQLNIDLLQHEPSWWWKGVYKLKFPLKSCIFL
jgi:hypothetical protein